MLDLAYSNTSTIYWNQLQWYGHFAEYVYCYWEKEFRDVIYRGQL